MSRTASIGRRVVEDWRDGGASGLRASGLRWLRRRLGSDDEYPGIRAGDLVSGPVRWNEHWRNREGPLTVTWIITPPGPGSGGHTTIFRMVRALEEAGHRCRLAVYDHHGRPAARYEETIRRWWPHVEAPVVDVDRSESGTDAFVATAWQTAHVLANFRAIGARLYFAQDYEPWFYPQGALSEFADQTYRFGFKMLTVGRAVADELSRRHGLDCLVVPYGCDHNVYSVCAGSVRDSIVFYSRPGVARRGFELALPALERFHDLRPEVKVHVVGTLTSKPRFPAVVHATLTPVELNALYRRCAAGLALSYTNVSLLPFELLAAGVVPVMNDWPMARMDLEASHAVWGVPTVSGMAEALASGFDLQRTDGGEAVAAEVSHIDWVTAGTRFVEAVEGACHLVPSREKVGNG